MSIPQHISDIIQKRLDEQPLTREEGLQLEQWLTSGYADNNLFGQEDWDQDMLKYAGIHLDQKKLNQALQHFMSAAGFSDQSLSNPDPSLYEEQPYMPDAPVHRIHFLRRWGWAAAVIVLFGAGTYLYTSTKKQQPAVNQVLAKNTDILPGSNKAVLTLSDGSAITLDSAAVGAIAQQGNSSIIKKGNGEIVYDAKGGAQSKVLMNTMATPRGGQYQLVLPDGTKVWLNAASSITYPTAFFGHERNISISGEAYLEVANNPRQPFNVNVNGVKIQVLGTSFNVNAYNDEKTLKTTLISGSVRVSDADRNVMLRPGEQAEILEGNDRKIKVQSADIDQTLSWKNGLFNFTDADFSALMRQIERWYDINVHYEGAIPQVEFRGKMNRAVPLSDIIKYLNNLHIDCRLEGRTLIVKG